MRWFYQPFATKRDLQQTEDRILKQLQKMATTLADILADVQAETTLVGSISQLLTNIKTELDKILAGGLSPEQQAAADSIFAQVEANKKAIADAIAANTPAAAAVHNAKQAK